MIQDIGPTSTGEAPGGADQLAPAALATPPWLAMSGRRRRRRPARIQGTMSTEGLPQPLQIRATCSAAQRGVCCRSYRTPLMRLLPRHTPSIPRAAVTFLSGSVAAELREIDR